MQGQSGTCWAHSAMGQLGLVEQTDGSEAGDSNDQEVLI